MNQRSTQPVINHWTRVKQDGTTKPDPDINRSRDYAENKCESPCTETCQCHIELIAARASCSSEYACGAGCIGQPGACAHKGTAACH